jgi:hypothetical protein
MFQPAHILRFRNQHPDGLVIAHPECSFEVCRQSDFVGSTEHIVRTIKEARPNTRWLVGTELNLVNRLAEEVRHEGKIVQFMAPTVCMCSTMQRIDPQHLAWTLENLADGKVVNQITVPEHERELAKLALERMLEVSETAACRKPSAPHRGTGAGSRGSDEEPPFQSAAGARLTQWLVRAMTTDCLPFPARRLWTSPAGVRLGPENARESRLPGAGRRCWVK